MSQNFPVLKAPAPTSPLSYVANKGETRQSGSDFYTWDGHDWVLTQFPSAQLDRQPVWPAADGSVTVGGDITTAGNMYANDYHVAQRISPLTGTTWLQTVDHQASWNLPQGVQYVTKVTTNGIAVSSEAYGAVGVTWTYSAARRLKITSKAVILPISSSGGVWESRAILRGAPGSSVKTTDPMLDMQPISAATNARNGHLMVSEIPPNTWADGIQVYVALMLDMWGPTTYSFTRVADPGYPTVLIKEDWGI